MDGGREGGRSHGQRENGEVGRAGAQAQCEDLCIDWSIAEEGGCGLLSGEREGSSESAAIFTSPPFLPIPVE